MKRFLLQAREPGHKTTTSTHEDIRISRLRESPLNRPLGVFAIVQFHPKYSMLTLMWVCDVPSTKGGESSVHTRPQSNSTLKTSNSSSRHKNPSSSRCRSRSGSGGSGRICRKARIIFISDGSNTGRSMIIVVMILTFMPMMNNDKCAGI